MDQSKRLPAWIGVACTWVGAAIGVFAVTALAVGLKATFTPDMRTVQIFDGILGQSSIVAFGVAAALMVTGAVLGRRRKMELAAERERLLDGPAARFPVDEQRSEGGVRDRLHPRDDE